MIQEGSGDEKEEMVLDKKSSMESSNAPNMKEIRESHTLRFSRAGWRLLGECALALYGTEDARGQYIEGMAIHK